MKTSYSGRVRYSEHVHTEAHVGLFVIRGLVLMNKLRNAHVTHSNLALFTTHGHKLGIEDDTYYEYSLEQRKDRAWMDDGFIL